jgi:cystathionine gamma-synthase
MDGFGAMLAFETAGGVAAADAVCERVRVLTHATSLAGWRP